MLLSSLAMPACDLEDTRDHEDLDELGSLAADALGSDDLVAAPDGSELQKNGIDSSLGDEDDLDGDGYTASEDCDDTDPHVHPGAAERCNGVDDDCDPTTSEDGLVSIDGDDSFTAIGDALAVAPSGAELRICPGTYIEHLTIEDDISLVAQQDAEVTIIEGYVPGPVITVLQAEVDIEGLTLTGGGGGDLPGGGGLSVYGADPVTVHRSIISGNTSGWGGGIRGHATSRITITKTVIADNISNDFEGGGIAFTGDELSLSNCIVEGNYSDSAGGGLWLASNSSVELSDTHVIDNTADHVGGGLAIGPGANVVMHNGVVERNTAGTWGGGARVSSSAVFESIDSDWGSGSDDNLPEDVHMNLFGAWSKYGSAETFTCDDTGCH